MGSASSKSWSRRRDEDHTDTRITKCSKINRHWFGVSKQEWRPCQKQETRQKNCAEWIYMPEWIEADAPESRRRFITEETRNKSVSSFVKSNGDKNRQ